MCTGMWCSSDNLQLVVVSLLHPGEAWRQALPLTEVLGHELGKVEAQ